MIYIYIYIFDLFICGCYTYLLNPFNDSECVRVTHSPSQVRTQQLVGSCQAEVNQLQEIFFDALLLAGCPKYPQVAVAKFRCQVQALNMKRHWWIGPRLKFQQLGRTWTISTLESDAQLQGFSKIRWIWNLVMNVPKTCWETAQGTAPWYEIKSSRVSGP